ncbi:MAG: DUF1876 domain-containing protein [Nocardioidaceae bacterium]
MVAVKNWHVDILVGEREGGTHAEARLMPGESVTMKGSGQAHLNPTDSDVPEIGDELAVARALSDLAHKLLQAAADDIAGLTHERVRLPR